MVDGYNDMNQVSKLHYQLIALNCRFTHSCLALFYVRNELERHLDCRVDIRQFTINDPYYDTLLRISNSEADALFFSVYIWNGMYIKRLVYDLKRIRPELPIILGGPQAPYLSNLPACCTVVHGEIEGVDASFYQDLEQGTLRPEYKSAPGNPFVSPYRSEDFTGLLQNRQIYYESSRGCPFFCSYCLSSVTHSVQHKDIDTVKQELENILAVEPLIIKFVDRTFNSNPQRTLAIWRYLSALPYSTKFHFEIAPDRFTEEMFQFFGDGRARPVSIRNRYPVLQPADAAGRQPLHGRGTGLGQYRQAGEHGQYPPACRSDSRAAV